MEARDVHHCVLWDEGNRNHKKYGIACWPSAYLIGADGKVFWQGNPARMQARPEDVKNLRKALDDQLEAARKRQAAANAK